MRSLHHIALRFWHVLPAMRPEHAPRAMLEEGKLERLRAWLEAVVERPSVKATAMAPDEMVQSCTRAALSPRCGPWLRAMPDVCLRRTADANMLERMKAMAAK